MTPRTPHPAHPNLGKRVATFTKVFRWQTEVAGGPQPVSVAIVGSFNKWQKAPLKFDRTHGIWQLTTPKWEADETDGWEMTSISAYILQAKGAYRMPTADLFSFAIFDAVEWAPGAAA